MSALDRVIGRVLARPQMSTSLENPQVPISASNIANFIDGQSSNVNQVRVSEATSLRMPAVWRAVNLIASSAASLPLHPYRQITAADDENTIRTKVLTGQAARLLACPHPDLTPFELWEITYAHMLLWGNAYLMKLRKSFSNELAELWPIHPSRVKAGRATDGTKVYLIDGTEVYTDVEILHLPGFGYDGVLGLSPIAHARRGVGLALAAEEFGAKLFESGSLASGLLTTDQRLTPDKADMLKDRWKAKNSGLANAHDVAVLDSGAKFQQLTIPPEDAQFIETRGFQIEEIARIYGVPPHMLMSLEKTTSWGAGIEQQSLGFVTFTLRPWLTRVEQRVTGVLKPEPVYARYSLEGLLRGDAASRSAFYKAMREMGALNANEIRAYEELPPIDGGEKYITPLNMGTTVPDGQEPTNAA